MPLTNPYNPYSPYTATYNPNQYQTAMPNTSYGMPQYGTTAAQPRLDNLTNSQPPQTQIQTVYGRVVESESEIKPNEVPMDGSIALFPKPDFSMIIAKQWSQNGTISTLKFVPEATSDSSEDTSAASMSIDELAKSMDSKFAEIKSMLKYRNGGRNSSKSDSKGATDE